MYPLFETIQLRDGQLKHLDWHQQRFSQAFESYFGSLPDYSLRERLNKEVLPKAGLYKLRLSYNAQDTKLEIEPYQIKPIQSLKLVHAPEVEYSLKYTNRKVLNDLWAKCGTCDDVLIVKDDLITDSWYCNILLYDGEDWYTPDRPLLAGTCRARLLTEGKVQVLSIRVNQLDQFTHFKLVNAMRDMDEVTAVPISQIFT